MTDLVPVERIERRIYFIRGKKVMVDRDLAELYEVETFNLNKAVKRNIKRFPQDFMFQLTTEEYQALRFQSGILEKGRHSKYLPYAFTEQGVAMLSSVLRKELEQKVGKHDSEIKQIFDVIKEMVEPKGKIGFLRDAGSD